MTPLRALAFVARLAWALATLPLALHALARAERAVRREVEG